MLAAPCCSRVVAAGGLPLTRAQPARPCARGQREDCPHEPHPHTLWDQGEISSVHLAAALPLVPFLHTECGEGAFRKPLPWLLQAREAQSAGHRTYWSSQAVKRKALSGNKSLGSSRNISRMQHPGVGGSTAWQAPSC